LEANDRHKNLCLQRLFDALYFSSAFCSAMAPATKQAGPSLQDLIAKLREAAGVDSQAEQRMAKSASEAWKRTGLLFRLLLLTTAG
jgi:cytochrome c551/c552